MEETDFYGFVSSRLPRFWSAVKVLLNKYGRFVYNENVNENLPF